jgi:hypothetical protein
LDSQEIGVVSNANETSGIGKYPVKLQLATGNSLIDIMQPPIGISQYDCELVMYRILIIVGDFTVPGHGKNNCAE